MKYIKFIVASADIIDTKDIPMAVLRANLNNIFFDRIIDVILPFIIARVIIKETGQSISMNSKYLILPKSPIQQFSKHHNVFLDAWDQVCFQYQSISNILYVDIKLSYYELLNLTSRGR